MFNAIKAVQKGAGAAALGLAMALPAGAANAQDKPLTEITYLLPAPAQAIAFAPFMLAQSKHLYEKEGLSVRFVTVKGGADVGKQLGAGNGQLGGALGDTPIILRQNGIPVKGVALLGGHALHQLMTREDRHINKPADLKGKTLTVMAYQDTSFYATLAILAKGGLTQNDVHVQAAGPTGIWQQVALGKADGLVGAPEMGAFAEEAGAKLKWESTGDFFPGMAQAIMASDDYIKGHPDVIRKFVSATLKSLAQVQANPDEAAAEYIKAVPAYKGREALVKQVMEYYAKNVYPGQKVLGEFNADRVNALQDFYLHNNIIRNKLKASDVFTNEFVK